MTDRSGPWNPEFDSNGVPVPGTGAWAQSEWYEYAPAWAGSGVIGSPAAAATSGGLAFTASGLSVSAGPGKAWVRGAGFTRTGTPPTHSVLANSHSTQHRRDRLVLRRDPANKQVVTAVKQGTPATTPTAPALTQIEDDIWEEPLFSFLVPPANGTGLTGVIDERTWLVDGTTDTGWRDTPGVGGEFTIPAGKSKYRVKGGWVSVRSQIAFTRTLTIPNGQGIYTLPVPPSFEIVGPHTFVYGGSGHGLSLETVISTSGLLLVNGRNFTGDGLQIHVNFPTA